MLVEAELLCDNTKRFTPWMFVRNTKNDGSKTLLDGLGKTALQQSFKII